MIGDSRRKMSFSTTSRLQIQACLTKKTHNSYILSYSGIYLFRRNQFTQMPILHAQKVYRSGKITVQEERFCCTWYYLIHITGSGVGNSLLLGTLFLQMQGLPRNGLQLLTELPLSEILRRWFPYNWNQLKSGLAYYDLLP